MERSTVESPIVLLRLTTALLASLLALTPGHAAASVPLQALRVLSDPGLGGFEVSFGRALATVGGRILVASPSEGDGRAYLFDALTGALVFPLQSPTPETAFAFGEPVAVQGANLLVGTPVGQVDLFDGATGSHLRTYANPNPGEDTGLGFGAGFGSAVAALGADLVVGAPFDDAAGVDAGVAYVLDGATGAVIHTLLPPLPQAGDLFGSEIVVVGSMIAVSAPATYAARPGAVHVFDAATGAWLRVLSAPEAAADDLFGWSLAVAGDVLLIGEPGATDGGVVAGAAQLVDPASGTLIRTFANPTPAAFDRFGWSVGFVGDGSVAVGAPFDNTGGETGTFEELTGAAYLLDRATGALLQDFFGAAFRQQFGWAVAPLGGGFAVSSPVEDEGLVDVLSPCGDGIVDPAEECDDGNVVDGDGCDSNCRPTGCGNQLVSPGEECDDGNAVGEDFCKNDCTFNVCGDGVRLFNGLEQCDDGNLVDGDGCDADCRLTLCIGGAAVRGARLEFHNLGPPYGDEGLEFRGTLVFSPGGPALFDPRSTGVQVRVDEPGILFSGILDLTASFWAPVPAGAPGSGCDRHDGWHAGERSRAFVYRNQSNLVDPPSCFLGAFGLRHLTLRRGPKGDVDFLARTKDATIFAALTGRLRGGIVLGGTVEAGAGGLCGEVVFEPSACRFDRKGTRVRCK